MKSMRRGFDLRVALWLYVTKAGFSSGYRIAIFVKDEGCQATEMETWKGFRTTPKTKGDWRKSNSIAEVTIGALRSKV